MPEPGNQPQAKKMPEPLKSPGGTVKDKQKVKKKINISTVICILLLLGAAGFIAAVYFDIGGLKQTIVLTLHLDEPTAAQLAEVEAQKLELEAQKQEFAKVSGEQKKTESVQKRTASELEKREKGIADREAAVKTKEEQLAALETQLNTKQVELKAMVAMFEKMDAAKAAAVISGMKNVSDMATILAGMGSDKAGAILNNMDPKIATKVLTAVIAQNGKQ